MLTLDQRRSRCYDLAKIFATILVVLGHAAVFYSPEGAMVPARESAFLCGLATYIYSFHMPLFVLTAGAVWGYCVRQGKYRENGPFLRGKLRRLGVPYLAFGLLLVAPVVVFCGYTEQSFLRYCIHGILLGYDARHLWYLLVLLLLFLSTLVMKPLVHKNPLWALPVCVALFLIANHAPLIFKLRTACKYALFFYLGVCADRYYQPLEMLAKKLRYCVPLLFLLLAGSTLWNPNFITETAYTLLGLAASLTLAANLTANDSLQRSYCYQLLKRDGFGLYLIHAMVIYLLFYWLGGTDIPPLILFVLCVAVSSALGLAGTELLRRAGLKTLIGE